MKVKSVAIYIAQSRHCNLYIYIQKFKLFFIKNNKIEIVVLPRMLGPHKMVMQIKVRLVKHL